ncbi:MAG: DUF5723 family protein [Salibacteraceae bacterium]
MKSLQIGVKVLLVLLLLSKVNLTFSQHIGASSDNYITTQKALYNPASIADPLSYSDFRLVGISALVQNNYIYFPKADFRVDPQDNFEEGKKYNLYSEVDVLGPAYTRAWKNRAVGFNIRFRNHVIGRKVPSSIAKFGFEGLKYAPQHNIEYQEKNFMLKEMAWMEVGLSYGQIVQKKGNMIFTAGGTLKLLNGMAAVSILGNDLSYEIDTSDIQINNFKGQLMLSVPGASKGLGAGLDFGVEYKKMIKDDNSFHVPHHKKGNCLIKEYKYKIGLSVLDFGFINFNKTTYNYKFDGDSIYLNDYVSNTPDGFTDISQTLDRAIANSGADVKKKEKAFATTPLTFVLQGDYNFENNFYLNAQLFLGIRQRNFTGAERMSSLTVTPRYEREKFTVGVPLSLYRYGKPGVGLYARMWFVSVGVNNFIPFALKNDMYNADVYASINIPIFQSNPCKQYISKKGNYCPKPKLKLFDFSKIKLSIKGKHRKKAERKKYRRVKSKKK